MYEDPIIHQFPAKLQKTCQSSVREYGLGWVTQRPSAQSRTSPEEPVGSAGTLWAALRQQVFHSQRGRPDMALILRIALEIAQALEHLHSLRILHRDITSKNILLQTGREDGLIHAKVRLKVTM